MKKIFILSILFYSVLIVNAQEFNKRLAEAKAAYGAGKLDDSRFAMQQMLMELDILSGKEILKVLPQKMQDQNLNKDKDNVTGATGFFGVIIHREFGPETKKVEVDIIGNSPLVGTLSTLMSLPFMGNNPDQKIIKINGYKALVQKVSGEGSAVNYELQLPLNSNLITLKAPGYSQDDLIKMANTLPVAEIAKILQ